MRIETKPTLSPSLAPVRRQAGGGTFAASGGESVARSASAGSAAAPTSLDALIAMQAADETTERQARRKRVLRRGRSLLDALDGLRGGLLSGRLTAADLSRLDAALAETREPSGDAGLDEVIAHIDLRAQVERAKLARQGGRSAG